LVNACSLKRSADYGCDMTDEVIAKEKAMAIPIDTVREFYAAIAAGDSGKMVGLMAPDIEWISMVDFNIQSKGPEEVMEKVFVPLMEEWNELLAGAFGIPCRWLEGGVIGSVHLRTPCNAQTC
jgi:hypothetical protein